MENILKLSNFYVNIYLDLLDYTDGFYFLLMNTFTYSKDTIFSIK